MPLPSTMVPRSVRNTNPSPYSSINITGDIYGHTSDDTARAVMDALAERLGHKKPSLSVVKESDDGDTSAASN